jgi:hypothetical protein
LLVAWAGLIGLVATSPGKSVFDEPYLTMYLSLLHERGLSRDFLSSLPGAMGPLHAFVQAAFAGITSLDPVGLRLVNLATLVAAVAFVAGASGYPDREDRLISAGSALAIPMAWVLGGMSLSEMPAIAFASLSLWLQLRGLQRVGEGWSAVAWFGASGLCLAVAVWGRQPFLLLGGVPVVLAIVEPRLRAAAAISSVITLALVVPLLVAWQGLTPPAHHFMETPPSPMNGVASLGYVGMCLLFLAPGMAWQHRRALLWTYGVVVVVNAALSILVFYPLRSAAMRVLPGYALWAYGTLWGALMLTFSLMTLAFVCHSIWQARKDLRAIAINLGLLLMAVWPSFMGLYYTSRYTGMALPFLLLAAEPVRQWRPATAVGALVGCAAGAVSLVGYYVLAA